MNQNSKAPFCNGFEVQRKPTGTISVFRNTTVEAKQQAVILRDVCGEMKVVGAPHYGLVLDYGCGVVPLIPVDCARNLDRWVSSVGRRVIVKKLLSICEKIEMVNSYNLIENQNYMVKWEDVRYLEEYEVQFSCENGDGTKDKATTTKTVEEKSIIGCPRYCRILLHHVSTPFHVGEAVSGSCLVFISYDNGNNLSQKLWLVLQGEQVAWRDFLVPHREYVLYFPPGTDKFFFDKSQKPLEIILKGNTRELKVLFHHGTHFSMRDVLNGSTVPPGTKIYLSASTDVTHYFNLAHQFATDFLWFKSWFSTSEADHADVPMVTFFGRVTSVIYLEEQVHKSCYLCIHSKPKEPKMDKPKSSVQQDPYKSTLRLEENVLIELPNVTSTIDGNSRMKTGVPGELVQVIKLEDLETGEERSVYIKHSYVSSCQQIARLAPGVIVCLSHLNRRCSTNGKHYYITTMLTCCRVLDIPVAACENTALSSEGWGMYGLCRTSRAMKTWGVLEPFNITKVAIRAKCNYCGALYFQRKCSNYCAGARTYTSSAYAIAWINMINDDKRITMEKVLIKDSFVQKLLDIPQNMWSKLEEAAAQEEILAFRDQALNLNESSNARPLSRSFQMYFSMNSRGKFYISVKKLSSQDSGRLYYCINLEPINNERLNIVADIVKRPVS